MSNLKYVKNLRSDFLGKNSLGNKSWYHTDDGNDLWYYWSEKRTPRKNRPANVDQALKDLVNFCLSNGIETLPSCEGHRLSEREAKNTYLKLLLDKIKIKENGLELVNSEDKTERLIFKNPEYELPFGSHKDLMSESYSGYIGLIIDDKERVNKIKEKLNDLSDDVKAKVEKNKLSIYVESNSQKKQKELWKKITKIIKGELSINERKDKLKNLYRKASSKNLGLQIKVSRDKEKVKKNKELKRRPKKNKNVLIKDDIKIDTKKEVERKTPNILDESLTHLETRLAERLGIEPEKTKNLSVELLNILKKNKPEALRVEPHAGTFRLIIPSGNYGCAFLWYYNDNLIFRSWWPIGSEKAYEVPDGWNSTTSAELDKAIEKYLNEDSTITSGEQLGKQARKKRISFFRQNLDYGEANRDFSKKDSTKSRRQKSKKKKGEATSPWK
jgi:hypothetical protein